MATLNANPKTSDASLRKSSTTFAGAHDGSTASSVIQASSGTLTTQVDGASDYTNYGVDRIVLPIDVSALGSGATVTAGTLAVNVSAFGSPGGTAYLDLIAISLADVNSIAVGDWASCVANYGTQCATRISFSSTGVKTFTLNAAGIAAVQANRTGTVVFAVIMGNDQANSITSPDTLYSSPFYTYTNIDSATGTSPPLLTVTYTAPAGGSQFQRRDRAMLPFYSFPD